MANGRQGQRRQGRQQGLQRQHHNNDGTAEVVKEIEVAINNKTFSTLSAEILVKQAQKIGESLARGGLKTTQIRKFLDAVNTIKSKGEQEDNYYKNHCMFLKPRLAYAAGRQQEVKPLMTVLEPCIDKIQGKEDFTHFHRFVEAIVAYHRFHGGRDN